MNEQGNNTNNVNVSTNTGGSVASTNTTPQIVNPSVVNTGVVSQPTSSSVANTGVVSQPTNPSVANTGVVSQPTNPSVANTEVVLQPANPSVNEVSNDTLQNNQVSDSIKTDDKISNYKPPGVFKSFLLILFFGGLVAFIIFLPEIQAYVADYMSGNTGVSEITSGKLKCSLETNTTNFNKSFERVFVFTDKKLQSATFTSITKGDITEDEEALDQLNETCKLKKDAVATIGGVTIACEYSNGLLTEREHFDYKEFDTESVKAAYTEAGADVIEYEYGYDIDKINTAMLQAGFTCKKEK